MGTQELKNQVLQQALRAKVASRPLAGTTTEQRNAALKQVAEALVARADDIIFKNDIDTEAATEAGLSAALIDRLKLDAKRIKGMADGLLEIAALPDPLGEVLEEIKRPNGLLIQKVRVPIGVI